MFSQANINNILDHQHSNKRLVSFSHAYFLAVKMSFFNFLPPESIMEMLTVVPVHFNHDLAVFSSASKKEVTGYASFLERRFGVNPIGDIVTVDCTNLVFSTVYQACLVEKVPWLALISEGDENYAFYMPEDRYNQIDYLVRQYHLIHPEGNLNIQTEGIKSGLITLF